MGACPRWKVLEGQGLGRAGLCTEEASSVLTERAPQELGLSLKRLKKTVLDKDSTHDEGLRWGVLAATAGSTKG